MDFLILSHFLHVDLRNLSWTVETTDESLSQVMVVFCKERKRRGHLHYNDVIMGAMASQITSLTIVFSTVYSGADQRKHQSSASLAFVRGIHR